MVSLGVERCKAEKDALAVAGMRKRIAWLATLDPPEPVRDLMRHMLRAAREIGPLPPWVERYPLTAMSPSTRQLAWAVARRIHHNPDHGFAVAERVPPHAIGSLWPMYRAAPDLAWIYQHYDTFSTLLLECLDSDVELSDTRVRICFRTQAVKLARALDEAPAGRGRGRLRALVPGGAARGSGEPVVDGPGRELGAGAAVRRRGRLPGRGRPRYQ